jgi:hypothetical protein
MREALQRGGSYFICGTGDPVELSPRSGDVLFPSHWTPAMAADWRKENITPGPEWPSVTNGDGDRG